MDKGLVQFTRVSGDTWRTTLRDVSCDDSGLYFITARNNQTEEKYPVILKIKPIIDLTSVTECSIEDG